jgi:hypothetical protein
VNHHLLVRILFIAAVVILLASLAWPALAAPPGQEGECQGRDVTVQDWAARAPIAIGAAILVITVDAWIFIKIRRRLRAGTL